MGNNYYKLFKVTLLPNEPSPEFFDVFVTVEFRAGDYHFLSGFSKAAEFAKLHYPGASVKSVEVMDEPAYSVSL